MEKFEDMYHFLIYKINDQDESMENNIELGNNQVIRY